MLPFLKYSILSDESRSVFISSDEERLRDPKKQVFACKRYFCSFLNLKDLLINSPIHFFYTCFILKTT